MKQAVVIIGQGEMGGVFARGFLKAGYPVYPVRREDDIEQIARSIDQPALVLLAVAEKDFAATLQQVPGQWLDKLALLQNELLPADWQDRVDRPTVISVWFEKKPGQDFKVLVPSPAQGPHAGILNEALSCLDIPVKQIEAEDDMLFELVRKNLYILTTNICGLETGGNVSDLWNHHSILMNKVFDDVLEIQQHLTGRSFNRDHLLNAVLEAFDGDPEHKCMGRSAPQRLQRALNIAHTNHLNTPELERLSHL